MTTYWNISERWGDWDLPARISDYEEVQEQWADEAPPSEFEEHDDGIWEIFPDRDTVIAWYTERSVPVMEIPQHILGRAGQMELVAEPGLPDITEDDSAWAEAVRPYIDADLGLSDARNFADSDLAWDLDVDAGGISYASWWAGTGHEHLWAELRGYATVAPPEGMSTEDAISELRGISGVEETSASREGVDIDIGGWYDDKSEDPQDIEAVSRFWKDATNYLANRAEQIYAAIEAQGFSFV